jgi:hypothetical protein
MDFAGWPPQGALSAELQAGPLCLSLQRVDQPLLDSLARWAGPSTGQASAGAERVEIEFTRSERPQYLVDPDPGEPLRMLTWAEPNGGFAMVTHEAALLVDDGVERGIAVLSPQAPERLDLSLQNLLRVATAWRLARSRRGLLLHAAALELDGRATLLLGHSGAGKTTALRLAGGRRLLGDDVALLTRPEDGEGDWLAHPHPFWAQPDWPGRSAGGAALQVSRLCSLRQGAAASHEPLPRSRAAVVVASCAPFLGASGAAFDPAGAAGALARALPAGVLTFAKEQPPWGCLSEAQNQAAAESAPKGE